MTAINVAVIGIGNCASSLVQGLAHYRKGANDHVGLMHWDLGGYKPSDVNVVAAWDVDVRKVGKDVSEAIFAKPNCTAIFCAEVPKSGAIVRMGKVLDGVASHMSDYVDDRTFIVANENQPSKDDVVAELKRSGADVLMNYLPVGSQEATEFYAECAIEAGVAFVNNIPVFIASDPRNGRRSFTEAGVANRRRRHQGAAWCDHRPPRPDRPVRQARRQAGADLPAQHRRQHRLPQHVEPPPGSSPRRYPRPKRCSRSRPNGCSDDNVHIGPSDYVPWQNDNKVCLPAHGRAACSAASR